MVEANYNDPENNPPAVLMYIAGVNGETHTYQKRMDELALFQNQVEAFDLEDPDGESLDNAFEGAEELLNGLDNPENGMFHVYFDGESRGVNGKLEVKLGDGTFYPL